MSASLDFLVRHGEMILFLYVFADQVGLAVGTGLAHRRGARGRRAPHRSSTGLTRDRTLASIWQVTCPALL